MSKQRYPEEFKTEAVKQITERGHKVADVSARLGVSQHSLYQWSKAHRVPAAERQAQGSQTDELRRLKAELKRVTEERDILKNGPPGSPCPIWIETRGALDCRGADQRPSAFWRRSTPSKNLAQGKLRTRLWWHVA
jgi:transposase